MIKINLLPVRAARKKENIRRQVSVFFLCVIFAFCVMAYLTVSFNQKISRLNQNIEDSRNELKKYEKIAKSVKKMRAELKKLESTDPIKLFRKEFKKANGTMVLWRRYKSDFPSEYDWTKISEPMPARKITRFSEDDHSKLWKEWEEKNPDHARSLNPERYGWKKQEYLALPKGKNPDESSKPWLPDEEED